MNLVSELDLPVFDYTAPDFSADRHHQQLAETRQPGWLAKSPLTSIVLDHDARSRAELEEALAFLAPRTSGLALEGSPQLGGVEGIDGIDKLPIICSGSSKLSPNLGLAPDVS